MKNAGLRAEVHYWINLWQWPKFKSHTINPDRYPWYRTPSPLDSGNHHNGGASTTFFCEVSSHWDPRIKTYWPIALYLSFKFIGRCLEVQPPYRGPWSRSASSLLFVSDPSRQSPRSVSLPCPTRGIHIECVQMFSFLHCTSCMRRSLLSSSCAACTANWYAQLGVLLTFCNIFCPVYLWAEHTYQLVPPNTVGWYRIYDLCGHQIVDIISRTTYVYSINTFTT